MPRQDNGNGWGRDAYEVANSAMEKAEQVERDVALRFNDIKESQREARKERYSMHSENKKQMEKLASDTAVAIAGIAGRVDRLYNRAWAVAITIMLAEGSIIVAVLGWAVYRIANP